jgi:HAE1 family hydrophobic/amphiphilic exporter-1
VFATGAGASSRHSLGTAIFGGMLVSTALNLVVIPALYLIVAAFDNRFDHHDPHGVPPNGEIAPSVVATV